MSIETTGNQYKKGKTHARDDKKTKRTCKNTFYRDAKSHGIELTLPASKHNELTTMHIHDSIIAIYNHLLIHSFHLLYALDQSLTVTLLSGLAGASGKDFSSSSITSDAISGLRVAQCRGKAPLASAD